MSSGATSSRVKSAALPNDPSRMTANDIRRQFLDYFKERGHTIVPSSSLVPANDPTLLFTNSGMVQFKDVFLGSRKAAVRARDDVQRCLRAGGKHNDLENVGYTARHHTFFEMLGNWSFGDYFKRDAIECAWELLTGVYGLPPEKLWTTVYHRPTTRPTTSGRRTIGVPPERCVRIGDNKGAPYASDNFWQMADTGPCGPCTEIFYDHGPGIVGRPAGIARGRRRPLHRDLEPGVHAVRPGRRRHADAAARAVRRHRDGTRTPGGRAAARAQQLRDRPLPGTDPCRRARDGHQGLPVAQPARHRRPYSRVLVPDRRRRDSIQRRPRLRAAANHPARVPSRLPARSDAAVLLQAGRPTSIARWATRIPSCGAKKRASRRC